MENLQFNVDPQTIGISVSDIKNMLPNWKTKVMEVYRYKNANGYELLLLIAANTEAEAKQWLQDYEELSKCSYSIRSTQNCAGLRVKFKQRLNCYHNTGSNSTCSPPTHKRARNTNCPSSINITLRTVNKRYQGKDKTKAPDPEFPCEIRINPVHNHSIKSADALRFRAVTNETKERLLNLFEAGHSPSTALNSLKVDIQSKHDNFHDILADRAVCPDYMYCYHLFTNHFKRKHSPLTKNCLEKRTEQHNQTSENNAEIEFIEDDFLKSHKSICSSNSKPEEEETLKEQQLVEEGTKIVKDISETFNAYLESSPTKAFKALVVLNNRLKKIKTVAGFTTACYTFSGYSHRNGHRKIPNQSTVIGRHALLSGKSSCASRRPKNGVIKRSCRKEPLMSSKLQNL